ncbi:unnamed protein product [Schistocephalus solidus]|uniref:CTNNB1_binding domain-containing protein n=1 Tax=Schistocephalus solidus TaxID=70667 RepID=A0A183TLM4_SCHSO|nr:unnamed protein product [Schistocephalus solidus]
MDGSLLLNPVEKSEVAAAGPVTSLNHQEEDDEEEEEIKRPTQIHTSTDTKLSNG